MDYFNSIYEEFKNNEKYLQMKKYPHHKNTSCYDHCYHVALYSYHYAIKYHLKVDMKSLIRGALLHDYYLYNWHVLDGRKRWHGFRHPRIALKNAERDFPLNDLEKDIIFKHMWPLTFFRFPWKRETRIVIHADHVCATKETLNIDFN